MQPADWAHLLPEHGPLAGMALQQEVREGWGGVAGGLGADVAPWQHRTWPHTRSQFEYAALRSSAAHRRPSATDLTAAFQPLLPQFEREAARRGGGGFVAPAQRVTDFLGGQAPRQPLPTSSYR